MNIYVQEKRQQLARIRRLPLQEAMRQALPNFD